MSFITVKYGDNQQKIFNPYCSSEVLLESIRQQCTEEEEVTIDLSDSAGNIKNLNNNLKAYANAYLEGRESYWLIKIEKGRTDNDPTKYSLMITDPESTCPELTSRLQDLSKPQTKTRKEMPSWNSLKKKVGKPNKGGTSGRNSRGSGSSKGKR
ncbi:uncharacterized protein CXorf65-like [Apostichopus japonicus]|uniref:uncharacterized protein CXorf65-like n=1 Tax=Stichopus japonicus TaxID=307972 RepID=UPI003AB52E4A